MNFELARNVTLLVWLLTLTSSCNTLSSLRDRFSPEEPSVTEIEKSAQTCIDLNYRSSIYRNKICLDDVNFSHIMPDSVINYDRMLWEEYLGIYLKLWMKELDLEPKKNSEVSIYFTASVTNQYQPIMLVDVEDDSWLVRLSVPLDPELWETHKKNEFFIDRAFVRPKPFSGNIVVQWRDQLAVENMERIIDLYPEAEVVKKQGLTWFFKTKISAWQDFARAFILSPYIKNNMVKWRAIEYSTNIEKKHKLVTLSYRSVVEKIDN